MDGERREAMAKKLREMKVECDFCGVVRSGADMCCKSCIWGKLQSFSVGYRFFLIRERLNPGTFDRMVEQESEVLTDAAGELWKLNDERKQLKDRIEAGRRRDAAQSQALQDAAKVLSWHEPLGGWYLDGEKEMVARVMAAALAAKGEA